MEVFEKLTIPSGKQLRVNKLPEYSKANITGKVYDLNGNLLYDSSAPSGDVVAQAKRLLGLPYSQNYFNYLTHDLPPFCDCSSLIQWSYYQIGKTLTRTTYTQWDYDGREITVSELQPGDAIYCNWSSPGVPEHVMMYIGGGQVIHAPTFGQVVCIIDVNIYDPSYRFKRF